jgi:hypothetical protein
MARTGDEDEVGRGAAVAQLSDAARRRSERASIPDHDDVTPSPDPSAGIELITNVRAEDHDAHVEALADDALDRALARPPGAPEATLRALPDRETPRGEPLTDRADPGQDDHQHVREILEHHHERRSPSELPTAPRGSADLDRPVRQTSPPRQWRSPAGAAGRARPRRRVAGTLAAVASVVAVVVVVGAEGSSTPKHHGTPATDTPAATQRITSPTSLIALHMTQATATIASEAKTAASAHTALEDKQKARAKARAHARAKAAARASSARARQRQQAAEPTHASSTAGSKSAGSTGTTATEPVFHPPSSPTSPSSTGASSGRGGESGSLSAPAGPTGIGSAGSNCNPQCS